MDQVLGPPIDLDRCETECRYPDAVRPLLGRWLGEEGARRFADLVGVIADPSRARVVHLLAISHAPLCVRDIALVVGMSMSALSHQLRFLRERGAVSRTKVGRIAYYHLVDEHLRRLVLDVAARVAAEARRDDQVADSQLNLMVDA